MKKFVTLLMVLGMASVANATIIDAVTDGVGSLGHTGRADSKLDVGETIQIALILNDNDSITNNPTYGPDYSYADGYWLSSMDLKITLSGPGTIDQKGITGPKLLKSHAGFASFGWSEDGGDKDISQLSGVASGDGIGGNDTAILVWNLLVTVTNEGGSEIGVALSHNIAGDYSNFPVSWGDSFSKMGDGDLGDLTLYCVPEPMTIALLGLGSLGMFYRRRRT
jgi:hypothetical protein